MKQKRQDTTSSALALDANSSWPWVWLGSLQPKDNGIGRPVAAAARCAASACARALVQMTLITALQTWCLSMCRNASYFGGPLQFFSPQNHATLLCVRLELWFQLNCRLKTKDFLLILGFSFKPSTKLPDISSSDGEGQQAISQ